MELDLSRAAAAVATRADLGLLADGLFALALATGPVGASTELVCGLAVIAAMVLAEFGARAVTVEVKKFSIPGTQYVSVEIYRTQ